MSADGNTPGRWTLSVQFRAIGKAYGRGLRMSGSTLLRVINAPPDLELRNDLPGTRGDCIDGPRPCPHWRCEFHGGHVESASRPGRPHVGGRRPLPLFNAAAPCVLDVVDANCGGVSAGEIGTLLGMTTRNAERLISSAVAKVELEAARDTAVAEELDANLRRREAILSPGIGEKRTVARMPEPIANVTLVVTVGDRRAEVTASPEQARALLAAMRNAGAGSVRDLAHEIRAALGDSR